MKQLSAPIRCLVAMPFLFQALPVLAAAAAAGTGADPSVPTWHAQTLGGALGNMLVFAAVGIAAAVVGYRIFDRCTPGDLHKEIFENRNVAAAILAAAVILGMSLIITAAMIG